MSADRCCECRPGSGRQGLTLDEYTPGSGKHDECTLGLGRKDFFFLDECTPGSGRKGSVLYEYTLGSGREGFTPDEYTLGSGLDRKGEGRGQTQNTLHAWAGKGKP